MDPATASELEKHDKLKEKYAQLKSSYAVLKKGVLDKQEEVTRLEQQLKEKETRLRQQLEEIDKLQYQNGRMSKQLGTLNAQVDELKQKTQQSSWSMGGLMSSKPQQEAVLKAEEEIRNLQDHMEMKIQENEELHMKLFSLEEEGQRLRDEKVAATAELEQKSAILDKERQHAGKLKGDVREATERIRGLEEELGKAKVAREALLAKLEGERREAKRQASRLEARLARWLPFNEGEHAAWSQWNLAPSSGREALRRSQALQRLQAAALEACAQGGGLLQAWGKAFGGLAMPGGQAETAQRQAARSRLTEAAQALGGIFRDTVPELLVAGALEVRRGATAVVGAHRRWVTCQSLLLLHDACVAGGEAARGPEAALGLVESLWHAHRCLRALAAKLRLLKAMPLLAARGASSTHFRLAKGAVRGGGGAKGGEEARSAAPSERLLARVAVALGDAAAAWEDLGRSLAAWATMVPEMAAGEVLEGLQRFHTCLSTRVMLAMDLVAAEASPDGLGAEPQGPAPSGGFLQRAVARLQQAPPSIGFEESQQTLLLARRLAQEGSRAKGDLRQQVERLQAAKDEKDSLRDELRSLQDAHELLRSNFAVLQSQGPREEAPPAAAPVLQSSLQPTVGAAQRLEPAAGGPGPVLAGAGELLLSSRQRAMLESLSVTAQESAALRQHGFFVDVISLSAGEMSLAASGPPDAAEASACDLSSWEVAVRKVYEQHCRGLQAQVRAADGRAMELQLSVQRCADLRREQEESKRHLQEEVHAKQAQLESVKEDITTTRKNYDAQLAMLTEHICTLSVRLSEKDASVASLHQQKILCGHCGTWNTMGRLMSKEGGGGCKTCGAKVLIEAG